MYARHFGIRATPQTVPDPTKAQVPNNAGGYAFAITPWQRLDRWLVLGAEGGTYYQGEPMLTVENAKAVVECIRADGPRVVQRIVEVSEAGRAPKQNPAIFALAMCCAPKLASADTVRRALAAIPRVCRTGTHLLHFAAECNAMRGWGRGLRGTVRDWFGNLDPSKLAYQCVKYRQRDKWSLRDLLRLSHAKPQDAAHQAIYRWVTCGEVTEGVPHIIEAFEQARQATDVATVVRAIQESPLPWEALDTRWLKERDVWAALLPTLPMTALVRNLGRMTENGLLSSAEMRSAVCQRIANADLLKKARVHPLSVLTAGKVYAQGHGIKGELSWVPEAAVSQALDAAFYLAFGAVDPSGVRLCLALDISSSMTWGLVAGSPLTPLETEAALALVALRTENDPVIVGFSTQLMPLALRPDMRIEQAVAYMHGLPYGGTDCARPIVWARDAHREFDAFQVFTDNETWAGGIHPHQALAWYRASTVPDARLVVTAMTSTGFTIADPNDPGMLDVVGCDSAAPAYVAAFCGKRA